MKMAFKMNFVFLNSEISLLFITVPFLYFYCFSLLFLFFFFFFTFALLFLFLHAHAKTFVPSIVFICLSL